MLQREGEKAWGRARTHDDDAIHDTLIQMYTQHTIDTDMPSTGFGARETLEYDGFGVNDNDRVYVCRCYLCGNRKD